jgi:hypothetical protein
VYPERIVRAAANYIVNGDDTPVRSLCVSYLSNSRTGEITSILRDCASKLRTREAVAGDDVVLRQIAFSLDLICNGPRPYAETVSMAQEILARLNSASSEKDGHQADRLR